MRSTAIDTTTPIKRVRQPLISRSSILILSGALIGFGVQLPLSSLMHISILGGGLVGLGAFLALDLVAAKKRKELRTRMLNEMNWTLESRLHKLIPTLHATKSLRRLTIRKDQTYLTVVRD